MLYFISIFSNVVIQLIIPGGESTTIPSGNVQTGLQGGTSGIQWTPDVKVGTNIVLVPGDDRGLGSGGSASVSIGNNPNGDSSCIDGNSPSSTPGTAAGAVETGGGSSSSSPTNIGAIVGGIVGGIAAVVMAVLLTLFFVRRRRGQKGRRRHSLDLLPESTQPHDEQYQPEPFIIPPSVASRSHHTRTVSNGSEDDDGLRPSMSEVGRRYSALSTTDQSETTGYLGPGPALPTTAPTSTTSRKSPHPPMLRPVNYVQHEDAGVFEHQGEGSNQEPETVELPPNYNTISR